MSEITRKRGDTKPFVFQLWEDKEAGIKLDITGFSFRFTVNKKKNPIEGIDNPEFTLPYEVVGVLADGKIRFIPTEENMDLEVLTDPYYYDMEVTDAEGFISTDTLDKLKIIQDISK